MNAFIDHANINTHVKIVAVALLAAILIVAMGIRPHIGA